MRLFARAVVSIAVGLSLWVFAAAMYRQDAQYECLRAGGDVAITSPFFKRTCIAFAPPARGARSNET